MVKRSRAASDAHEARTPQKRPRLDGPPVVYSHSQPVPHAHQHQTNGARKSTSAANGKRAPVHHSQGHNGYTHGANGGGGSGGTPQTPRSDSFLGGRKMWELTPEEMERKEEEFERQHGSRLLAQMTRKRERSGTIGAIAEFGVIDSLELKNFMCHPHLRLDFGPQCNFIIGHNGSGKSAVLSALTIALGGKTASTGRGTGLKGFIREGQHAAEVTVGIRNRGDEAYKSDEYGDVIYVTRTFTADGASQYKLQNSERKVISRRRGELTDICDHLNLQVDNPFTVLTQDAARHFLSSSRPRDKYEFFMRGTLLTQLAAEYDLIEEKIAHAMRYAEGGSEIQRELQYKRDAAVARHETAQRARGMEREQNALNAELAWAHVAAKHADHTELTKKFSAARAHMRKLDAKLGELQAAHDHMEAMLRAAELELPEENDRKALEAEKATLGKQIKSLSVELREFANDQKQMNRDVQGHNKRIEELQVKIDAEQKKLARDHRKVLGAIQARADVTKASLDKFVAMHEKITTTLADQEKARDAADAKAKESHEAAASARQTMKDLDESINRCTSQQANGLAVYGNNIKAVIQAIRDEQWAGKSAPIGPLGLFVELRDKQWAHVLRTYLGKTMMSFAVSDVRDRAKLKKILNDTNNRDTSIIIAPIDIFDYRKGEPQEGVLTILRALKIENPWALRIFINAHRIEQTGLARTRRLADEMLSTTRLSFAIGSEDLSMVRAYAEGGRMTQRLPDLAKNDPRRTLFVGTSQDLSTEIKRLKDERKGVETMLKEVEVVEKQGAVEMNKCSMNVKRLVTEQARAKREINKQRANYQSIQDEMTRAAPVSVAGFESSKAEEEERKAEVLKQFTDLEKRANGKRGQLKPLQTRVEEIASELEMQDAELVDIKARVHQAEDDHRKSGQRVDELQAKRNLGQDELDSMQEAMKVMDANLASWTDKATKVAPRVPNPREVKVIETKLRSLANTLAHHQKEQGATVEEIAEQMTEAEADYRRMKRYYRDLGKLIEVAENALDQRREKWYWFRMHMSLRCKMQFTWHLSTRAYWGKVMLKHQKRELQLEVRTEDQALASTKDPKALSGGEKSFSTICFLLSLWDSIGSPMRCLDEFDVFMDAVNRKVTMRMIMDAANEADQKQYILISPQSLTGLKLMPSVKVLRMRDPERGDDEVQ